MEIIRRHEWHVTTSEAIQIQTEIASKVTRTGSIDNPRLIAGVDISVDRMAGTGTSAVVVLNYPELEIVETGIITDWLAFPYVPGLLSFREAPLVLAACERLKVSPDLFIVDGQGIAHPRRVGLASHLGLFLDTPTIGCAKSRLCGQHEQPGIDMGDCADLVDADEVIGVALRTRMGVKPVYVSIGHRIDLPTAVHLVLVCCRGYRLPEPTRLAHQAAGSNLNVKKHSVVIGERN